MHPDDKAGAAYWESNWARASLPPVVKTDMSSWTQYADRVVSDWVEQDIGTARGRSKALLEAGCGASAWLPYLARHFNLSVSGIDSSAGGCRMAEACLAREGVAGEVILGDFFSPPREILASFDYVISRGVVEHFSDTARVLRALAKFLRPGGTILTVIPNLAGPLGAIQKRVNADTYNIHVALDKEQLVRAHEDANLAVTRADYLVPLNFGLLNLNGLPAGTPTWLLKRVFLAAGVRVTHGLWAIDQRRPLRLTRATSSLIACSAQTRSAASDA